MASLRDAQRLTKRLQERTKGLHQNLTGDDVDFGKLVELADQVGASADYLAATFAELDEALTAALGGGRPDTKRTGDARDEGLTDALSPRRAGRGRQRTDSNGESTKDELLKRARELDLPGRSEMSKDELVQALDQEDGVTKAELLERAKKAGIAGRSEMSKDELRRALSEAD